MNRIKELRIQHNLKMKELGDRINVSESAISQYESGKRKPDYDTLTKLADIFNVSIDYLLGRVFDFNNIDFNNFTFGCKPSEISKEPTSQEEVSSKLKNAMAAVGLKPCDLDKLSEDQIELVVGFAQQLIDKHKK